MDRSDLDSSMAFIHENEAGSFIAHLFSSDIYGAVNGSSVGMISPRDIIGYVEGITGKIIKIMRLFYKKQEGDAWN